MAARQRADDLRPVVMELRTAGLVSLRAIASGLNERGIRAAMGGEWQAQQVKHLLAHIDGLVTKKKPPTRSNARQYRGQGADGMVNAGVAGAATGKV